MDIKTIEWKNGRIRIIDQRQLPGKLLYRDIAELGSLWKAIKDLSVRGAPALGAAAGLGVYLGVKDFKPDDTNKFFRRLSEVAGYLATSRPTARNLFWGIERVCRAARDNRDKPVKQIKKAIFSEAEKIILEDKISCRRIAKHGATLIKDGMRVMTICNAGALATIDYGTALGIIYRAAEEGKQVKVFACETRPLLQGSRLTAWELSKKGIDVVLIADNTAASLMQQKEVDIVITGADRIAANADTANKIGTLNLALLAKYHKIPFYVAAPQSTFDLCAASGKDIDIEMRSGLEVARILLKEKVAPQGAKVLNPAFDVTAASLISAVITDKGIIRPPYKKNIKKIIAERSQNRGEKC